MFRSHQFSLNNLKKLLSNASSKHILVSNSSRCLSVATESGVAPTSTSELPESAEAVIIGIIHFSTHM